MELEFDTSAKAAIDFWVSGIPAPGGSKRFMGIGKKTGRAILIDAGGQRNKNWRAAVADAGQVSAEGKQLLRGALALTCMFIMPRPKKHFFTTKARFGELRDDAPTHHISAPDTTKLLRSTEDALKGIVWADDSQVAEQFASKTYGDKPGCRILITEL